MDVLWMNAGMTRTHDFNFSFLPEILGGDALTGTPTVTYTPNDGNLTLSNITINGNKVFIKFVAAAPAAGKTYTVICQASTVAGEVLIMKGQLQVF